MNHHTICAVSTPLGSGGIGIVRLSGAQAILVAERVFRSTSGRMLRELKGYTGLLGRIYDASGALDDAIAYVYRAPRSYTGEDVVELSCHGGPWIVQRVLRLCLENGARPAGPGEFTKRAFLNGKMDLSAAEGVMDLISAQGDSAMRAALSARDGALSCALDDIINRLLGQAAHLAAWADFPDEDLEAVESDPLIWEFEQHIQKIHALLATWDRGRILREGAKTVIVGRPNVGKSTLMNLLAGEQRSIVTDIPGTTRDIVEDTVRLGDCVLLLADTAGLRNTDDPVEQIGVDRAWEKLAAADLILAVFDRAQPLAPEDRELLAALEGRPCIAVLNKADLPQQMDINAVKVKVERVVSLSAKQGQGREMLEQQVAELLGLAEFDSSAPMVARERQRQCLTAAVSALEEAVLVLRSGMTLDAIGVLLDEALDALLTLTGRKATEAVVDEVFAQFCVGK